LHYFTPFDVLFINSASGAFLDQDADQFSPSAVNQGSVMFAGTGRRRIRSTDAILLPLRTIETSGANLKNILRSCGS
jgi:hypothetical protein